MNVKVVFSTIGRMLLVEAVLLCLPLTVALIYQEYNYILRFIIPIVAFINNRNIFPKIPARPAFFISLNFFCSIIKPF